MIPKAAFDAAFEKWEKRMEELEINLTPKEIAEEWCNIGYDVWYLSLCKQEEEIPVEK